MENPISIVENDEVSLELAATLVDEEQGIQRIPHLLSRKMRIP